MILGRRLGPVSLRWGAGPLYVPGMNELDETAPRVPWWGPLMCVILLGHLWLPFERPGGRVVIRCADCRRAMPRRGRRVRRRRVAGRGPLAVAAAWLIAAGMIDESNI